MRDRRKERNLTRILAAVVKDRGSERERGREVRQTGHLGRRTARPEDWRWNPRPPLERDQCTCCKKQGHWAKECPERRGKEPRILTLEKGD